MLLVRVAAEIIRLGFTIVSCFYFVLLFLFDDWIDATRATVLLVVDENYVGARAMLRHCEVHLDSYSIREVAKYLDEEMIEAWSIIVLRVVSRRIEATKNNHQHQDPCTHHPHAFPRVCICTYMDLLFSSHIVV